MMPKIRNMKYFCMKLTFNLQSSSPSLHKDETFVIVTFNEPLSLVFITREHDVRKSGQDVG